MYSYDISIIFCQYYIDEKIKGSYHRSINNLNLLCIYFKYTYIYLHRSCNNFDISSENEENAIFSFLYIDKFLIKYRKFSLLSLFNINFFMQTNKQIQRRKR